MQEKLLYDDEYQALSLMIGNSQKSVKELADYLYPHLKPESAYARLKACLNPDRDERLTFGQIIAAMKFCERYDPLFYACDETLHGRPDRKVPEDQEAKLIVVIGEATGIIHKALSQLERLKTE